jgi:hypothetical protein
LSEKTIIPLHKGIPSKIFFTDGKGAERPFVSQILSPGQTGVCDRGYQEHAEFDSLQSEGKHFVIRIKYLLLAIYCHQNHGERVNIKRVRQLRIQIQNELRDSGSSPESHFFKEQKHSRLHAKI